MGRLARAARNNGVRGTRGISARVLGTDWWLGVAVGAVSHTDGWAEMMGCGVVTVG